jgi:hypothetical protein
MNLEYFGPQTLWKIKEKQKRSAIGSNEEWEETYNSYGLWLILNCYNCLDKSVFAVGKMNSQRYYDYFTNTKNKLERTYKWFYVIYLVLLSRNSPGSAESWQINCSFWTIAVALAIKMSFSFSVSKACWQITFSL